jgi:isocitrate dehydrogenase
LDNNSELLKFSLLLEEATIEAVEKGWMTKDLAILATGRNDVKEGKDYLVTEAYMDKIDSLFKAKWEKVKA